VRGGVNFSSLCNLPSGSEHSLCVTSIGPERARGGADLPFSREVLKKRLDPTDCALLARACYKCGEAVASAGVVRADSPGSTFKVKDFVVTVELLAWAQANGCPWESRDDDLWRCRHSLSYWVCLLHTRLTALHGRVRVVV